MNLTALKLASSLALVAFGVAACAADSDPSSDDQTADESTTQDELNSANNVGSCKSKASFLAAKNRECPGRASCTYNTTYTKDGKTKQCPGNGASSASCRCN